MFDIVNYYGTLWSDIEGCNTILLNHYKPDKLDLVWLFFTAI